MKMRTILKGVETIIITYGTEGWNLRARDTKKQLQAIFDKTLKDILKLS